MSHVKNGLLDWYLHHTTEATVIIASAQTLLAQVDKNIPWWLFVTLILVVEGGKLLKIKADNAAAKTDA